MAIFRAGYKGSGSEPSCIEKRLLRGVTGWVRNLPDGRVEVQLSGEQSVVDELVGLLGRGPRLARVGPS